MGENQEVLKIPSHFHLPWIQIPLDIFCLALEGSGILAKQLWEAQSRFTGGEEVFVATCEVLSFYRGGKQPAPSQR